MHIVPLRRFVVLLFALILGVAASGRAAYAAPPAPTLAAPADDANVVVPFALSWSAVNDPAGVTAYNWEVSPSPNFTSVILLDSTSGATQDTVSGLASGSYYWHVQAVNGFFEQGAWSQTRSFNVTGVGNGSPGTPTLAPMHTYSTFHPWEVLQFNWSAVPNAATYVLQWSKDPSFPVLTRGQADNIPDTTYGFRFGNDGEGNYFARVYAVSADGIAGVPSNVITFSVFFNNPVGPPPVIISPINNPTLTLPFALNWEHVPYPQPSGYEVQISGDPAFTTNEAELGVQLTNPTFAILSLTPGPKFWRVRSHQGMSSPTLTAPTAWSATGTFTLSTAPATPVSITPFRLPLYSGDTTFVAVQLTAGVPASGATIALNSSNQSAAPVPTTIPMQGNAGWTQFQMQAGQVTEPTPVTLTATLNGVSAVGQITVMPPSLKSLSMTPSSISGGTLASGIVMLNGQAPPNGALVSLSSNSPAVSPPATVMVAPGEFSVSFPLQTNDVATNTTATVTASWNGNTTQSQIRVTPGPVPTSLTLFPATVTGGGAGSVDGSVTIASPAPFDQFLQVTSDNPAVLPFLSKSVMIPANTTRGAIQVITTSVSVQTVVTISVTGGGVTKSATLTVNPAGTPPPPTTLSSFSVNPKSVIGGSPATGTVTLPSAAPAGGTVVTLSSSLPGTASMPASVTIPAGAKSANFTVTTFPSATTTVQLSARLVDSILFAQLGVNPPAPPPTPSAPTLLSPANTATVASPVILDWSDVANAASYTIQIDDSNGFTTPLVAQQSVTASQLTTSGLSAVRHWWRVRAVNSAGVAGAWSAVRSFTPKAAPAAATLSSVTLSPSSVIGGNASTATLTLTSAAPSGGAPVSLSSSNAAVASLPASVTIPAGATSATFTITTTNVSTSTPVTISASYNSLTRTATLTALPRSSTPLPSPSLLSPATDAQSSPGQAITFDWNDVAGASSYTIQIDDSQTFSAPLTVNQTIAASQFTTSTLPTTRMWWRVRANDAAGNAGAWSAIRRFEVKN